MIDSEFERKGREMSDELNQIQPIDEVDLEYRLDAEPLPVPVCLQVKTCNGAVVMALQAENDQLRAELEKIRVALRGYADSDLASLAQTIQARNEKAEAELEQVKAERDAALAKLSEYEAIKQAQVKTDVQVAACSCVEPVLVGANPLESVCMWCGKRVRNPSKPTVARDVKR